MVEKVLIPQEAEFNEEKSVQKMVEKRLIPQEAGFNEKKSWGKKVERVKPSGSRV